MFCLVYCSNGARMQRS